MQDLKYYKIDSPCAPVADLWYDWADKVIGSRSFGQEVQKVVDLSKAAIQAIQEQEGVAIIKHIPGHGRANCDSHYHLPVIDTPLDELNKTDFEVFRQLATYNKDIWAMTAHIIYTELDQENPATLSKIVVKFIRENIGFKGILITDDICMRALHNQNTTIYPPGFTSTIVSVACQALDVGCDIVLHCNGDLQEMTAICAAISSKYTARS